jgi:hypothetical protein
LALCIAAPVFSISLGKVKQNQFAFCTIYTEVGKVTLKSNGDEALSDESLKKSNGDEALSDESL